MANAGTFKKGEKRPKQGKRGKGKFTTLKQSFLDVYEKIGGSDNLAAWATENPSEFYKLVSKLLPKEVDANIDLSGEVGIKGLADALDAAEKSMGVIPSEDG